MKKWIIIVILIALLICIICIFIGHHRKEHGEKRKNIPHKKDSNAHDSDEDFYNLNNVSRYRNGVYQKVNVDFRPYIEKLYRSIDELNSKVNRYNTEINQAQYNSMVNLLKMADRIENQIREYWNSCNFNKDFMYYIGLHYASHLLAGTIKAEQQKIKDTFVACKRKQEKWGDKIDTAQRRKEQLHGEARHKLSDEIGEMCKIHKNISLLKGQIGAINTQYNNRVTQQNIETAKRRDYIGTHFGERGRKWRARIMERHQ